MNAILTHPGLTRLVAKAKDDLGVLAVLLFGSQARGEATPRSDLDVCLVLGPDPIPQLDASQKRLDYLAETDLDLAVFQLLPLVIRSRILKEGQILFVRDEDALYALAAHTAKAFEDFRHIHRQYLDEVSRD